MAEPSDRRSVRLRKPIVHFDDKIAQSLVPKNPTKPTKPKPKPKPTTKSTENPLKLPAPPTTLATISSGSVMMDSLKYINFDEFVKIVGAKKCQGAKMYSCSERGDTILVLAHY
jgi:hypothetical protein